MDQQFSHCAGRLTGIPGDPQVTVTPSRRIGCVATASDDRGNTVSAWGPTEDDARTRVQALWCWNPDLRRNHAT